MNLPTKITVSRIIATVILLVALFVLSLLPASAFEGLPQLGDSGINLIFLIVCVFFGIASYTDHLDGKLARKNNQVTALGKFLDPVADKLLINSMVIFLACPFLYGKYNPNQISFNVWCVIILVIRDTVVDALRFIAAQKNKVIAANIFGKLKTVLEMVAIIIVLLNGHPFNLFDQNWPTGLHIADIFVYLATIASVVSGIIYVIQNREVLKADK